MLWVLERVQEIHVVWCRPVELIKVCCRFLQRFNKCTCIHHVVLSIDTANTADLVVIFLPTFKYLSFMHLMHKLRFMSAQL